MVKSIWAKLTDPQRVFVIAEAGVNHNGSLAIAKRLVDAAQKAGADAVKFQTFVPELTASRQAPKAHYQHKGTGKGDSQLAMLKKLALSFDDHHSLAKYCQRRGIMFLSTPFDGPSVDLLQSLGMPLFKIPSGEITNIPFLKKVGTQRKPVILSTGMSDMAEIKQAVKVLRAAGVKEVAVLHCVSSYPTPADQANLNVIPLLSKTFKVPVGFSDHTLGIDIALAAVALGAQIIEKHFTLDKVLKGPDQAISLKPKELAMMVQKIHLIKSALGNGQKCAQPCEADTARVARRSIVAAVDIEDGEVITKQMLAIKRPGTGIAPQHLEEFIGKPALKRIASDQLLQWGDVR